MLCSYFVREIIFGEMQAPLAQPIFGARVVLGHRAAANAYASTLAKKHKTATHSMK